MTKKYVYARVPAPICAPAPSSLLIALAMGNMVNLTALNC